MTKNINANDPRISAQIAKIKDIERRLAIESARLDGMLIILSSANSEGEKSEHQNASGTISITELQTPPIVSREDAFGHIFGGVSFKGRQHGAISHRWRDIIESLYISFPEGFHCNQVVDAAKSHGADKLSPSAAEARMAAYIKSKYVEKIKDKFRITEYASNKYGFK